MSLRFFHMSNNLCIQGSWIIKCFSSSLCEGCFLSVWKAVLSGSGGSFLVISGVAFPQMPRTLGYDKGWGPAVQASLPQRPACPFQH